LLTTIIGVPVFVALILRTQAHSQLKRAAITQQSYRPKGLSAFQELRRKKYLLSGLLQCGQYRGNPQMISRRSTEDTSTTL
jgi:hypothetical protein